jgi:hypothetical protein
MLTPSNLVVFMLAMIFVLGMISFIAGALILIYRASSSEMKELTLHTAQLAQKGIAEDIAGLVGNAANLLDSLEQMVRTVRGIGMFLMLTGVGLMAMSVWFALLLYRSQP